MSEVPISGFWRRVGAFVVDGIVLGIVGQLLVWTTASFWFRIGPYGRIVGALIALAYFALLNSRIGGGRTLGKRVLGIAVVDRMGQPIGVGRSIARTLIWLLPLTFNGWSLPLLAQPFVTGLATVLVFGVGGAVAFTLIFNARTRQALHDLVCGTYVVRVDEPITELPTATRMPWIASAIILALAMLMQPIGMLIFPPFEAGTLGQMLKLQKVIQRDARFFSVGVLDQTFTSSRQTTHALKIDAWYKGRLSDKGREQVMNEIARTALQSLEGIERYDRMVISITSAYDLGIARGNVTHNDAQPIATWKARVLTTPPRAPARE
jgi:uncharacterized RDD family membrane protein YckC